MKNNQVIFEEGVRDMAATAARKVQKQLKEVTLENRSLIKHVELQAKLITEFIGRVLEIETATGGLNSSASPKLNSISPWLSMFIPLESRWYEHHKRGAPTREAQLTRVISMAIGASCAGAIVFRPE